MPRSRPAGGWAAPWRPSQNHGRRPARPRMETYGRRITAELDVSAAVTLNSGGAGAVTLAPDGGNIWDVTQVQISTTTGPTDGSQVMVYRSGVFAHRQLVQSAQGGGDTFDFRARLRPGDTLICVWAFGVPGDAATMCLIGRIHALAA